VTGEVEAAVEKFRARMGTRTFCTSDTHALMVAMIDYASDLLRAALGEQREEVERLRVINSGLVADFNAMLQANAALEREKDREIERLNRQKVEMLGDHVTKCKREAESRDRRIRELEGDVRGLTQAFEHADDKEQRIRERLKASETEMADLRDEILRLKNAPADAESAPAAHGSARRYCICPGCLASIPACWSSYTCLSCGAEDCEHEEQKTGEGR
jgi:hypothetical protein